jgi:hypothetical protein
MFSRKQLWIASTSFEKATRSQVVFNSQELLEEIRRLAAELPPTEEATKLMAEHSFFFLMEQIINEVDTLQHLQSKILN